MSLRGVSNHPILEQAEWSKNGWMFKKNWCLINLSFTSTPLCIALQNAIFIRMCMCVFKPKQRRTLESTSQSAIF